MDFLPEVKTDFIPSDEEEENIDIEIDEFDQEKDKSHEEIEEEKEEPIEKVVPKAKNKRDNMDVNDIFNMPSEKLTKSGKPRKKRPPMSEAHKEKLKAAREKAMEARKKKAQEKKEARELEKQEKELLKKQKIKRVNKLKKEVEEDDPVPDGVIDEGLVEDIKRNNDMSHGRYISKKELEEAQLQAIMNYEKIRKERKAEKQERLKKEKEQEQLKATIRRAVQPPVEYNPFSGCY
jgi:hypothetical protein